MGIVDCTFLAGGASTLWLVVGTPAPAQELAEPTRAPEHRFDWHEANTPSTPELLFSDDVELAEGVSEHMPATFEEDEGVGRAPVLGEPCGKVPDKHGRLALEAGTTPRTPELLFNGAAPKLFNGASPSLFFNCESPKLFFNAATLLFNATGPKLLFSG